MYNMAMILISAATSNHTFKILKQKWETQLAIALCESRTATCTVLLSIPVNSTSQLSEYHQKL